MVVARHILESMLILFGGTKNTWNRTQPNVSVSTGDIHSKYLKEGEITELWSNLGKLYEARRTGSRSIRRDEGNGER